MALVILLRMKKPFFILCLFAFLHHYKQMYKQKHTMARQLNSVLPSSNFCIITQRGKGSCAETLLCTRWAMQKKCKAGTPHVCVWQRDRQTRTEISSIQRSVLWRKRFWQVSVHPWHVLQLILCAKRVVCRMEEIQFPLTCCFIPESVFPPSPLHLHNPWRGFGQSAWKRYSLELTFFLKLKFSWHERHWV